MMFFAFGAKCSPSGASFAASAANNLSFNNDASAAEKLVAAGSAERPANINPIQLAAWTMTANVLLNLDETLNKE